MQARALPSRAATGEFGRTLVAVAIGLSAHWLVSHLALSVASPIELAFDHIARRVVDLAVFTTAVAQLLAAVWLRRQTEASSRRFIAWLPRVARLAPPLFTLGFARWLLGASAFTGDTATVVAAIVPIVAAVWSGALLVALVQKRVLHALTIRTRIRSTVPLIQSYEPPPLADSFAHVLAGACVAVMLPVGASILARALGSSAADAWGVSIAAASLATCLALAWFAGSSIGRSPGRDVATIARRLDAVGYDSEEHFDQSVVVTSHDEVGTLFFELERLRTRLSRELQLYERALGRTRDTEASKAEFLAAVSHELRTPLNSICGFAQLLLDDVPSPLTASQREDVELVLAGGHQLLALINDILDISLIETGELSLAFSDEDIGEIIDEIVRIHSSLVRDKDVVLVVKTPPDLPRVTCDRRRVSQVLTNLLSNAIKFTDEGSIELHTSYSIEDARMRVAVKDTGEGIPQDMQQSVFEEYRQAVSLKTRAPGTGLGLAIARSIAVHHGGSLTLHSVEGQGSTFTLELPFEPPARPSSIDMTREAVRAARRRGHLDDNESYDDFDPA